MEEEKTPLESVEPGRLKKFLKRAGHILVVIILVFLLIVMGKKIGFLDSLKSKIDRSQNISGADKEPLDLSSCSTPVFTQAPMDLETFKFIVPLGQSGASHIIPSNHIYMFHDLLPPYKEKNTGIEKPDETFPLRAPADMTITMVRVTNGGDYTLNFSPCKGLKGFFAHVYQVSDKINEAYKKNVRGRDCQTGNFPGYSEAAKMCSAEVEVKVKAGEVIAEDDGWFDFALFDRNKPPAISANPGRWERSDDLYSVCAIDYLPENLKSKSYNMFGNLPDLGMRTAEPLCGKVMQDVPGAAKGVWFPPGTPLRDWVDSSGQQYLSLVDNNINPAYQIFSIGREITALPEGPFTFYATHSGLINRDFAEVLPDGQTYCYEGQAGDFIIKKKEIKPPAILLLNMPNENSLKIGNIEGDSCGAGPWTIPNDAIELAR